MYDIPSEPQIRECVINEEVIENGKSPILVYENQVEYA